MSKLSESLISEFAKMTKDTDKKKPESFLYGTVDSIEGSGDEITVFVLFDGGSDLTPCRASVNVAVGDRVLAMFKNRQAIITANISNPTINASYLEAGEGVFTGSVKVLGSNEGLVQLVDISPGEGDAVLITGDLENVASYRCRLNPTSIEMTENIIGTNVQTMSIDFSSLTFRDQSIDTRTRTDHTSFYAEAGTGAQIQYSELTYQGVHSSSDARLKKDVEPITPELAKKLRPVQFRYLGSDAVHYGFIAQDVQGVLPDTVSIGKDGYLLLNYSELIAPILSLVQDLERRVEELESKCNQKLSD